MLFKDALYRFAAGGNQTRREIVTLGPAGTSSFQAASFLIGEWCLDNVAQDYGWDLTGQDPVYLTDEHDAHIVRGGSGLHDEDCLRCASRDNYPPGLRDNIVGLRCVKNLS